ncbi:MAG TPA: aminoacyl--tRNA ligase-related protein [Candidatus Paceibacterota bacterium]|jgi:prolyl-tRNA synthetase
MRQSTLFTKTRREAPKDEIANNAKLLIRAGFIHKEMAGVYDFLPLGLRVMQKIEAIIRTEMNRIGGQEILLSTLQDPTPWTKTDRWTTAADIWFTTTLSGGAELGLGFTHEEPLTALMKEHVSSYKDLPIYPYQIQTKFRNEQRAKSGIMRTREFAMKDLYSFSRTEHEHRAFYERCAEAYLSIFSLVGLSDTTYRTFASGGLFSKFSDEFQTVAEVGEDTIYIDEKKRRAVNKEVLSDEVLSEVGLARESLVEKKAIEVGNIFSLGTRFSEALGLQFVDEQGEKQFPVMGSYGIGPARLLGVVAEVLSDERGLVWPSTIAPFDMHFVVLPSENAAVKKHADELYERLLATGVDVLYDDRDLRAGEKFADSDLIGIPTRAILSERTFADGKVELVDRRAGGSTLVTEEELLGAR